MFELCLVKHKVCLDLRFPDHNEVDPNFAQFGWSFHIILFCKLSGWLSARFSFVTFVFSIKRFMDILFMILLLFFLRLRG